MAEEEKEKVGLANLSDEALARIVEGSLDAEDKLDSDGSIALAELNRRDPNYDR